jgi:hypothetical protein
MDTLYRLYTEGGPRREAKVREIVGAQFDGFTILQAEGSWKGQRENSIVVEILVDSNEIRSTVSGQVSVEDVVRIVATDIKFLNVQETVIVTRQNVTVDFI